MTPTEPPASPGATITRLREAAGLTRYALAKKAGITATHLEQVEDGADARISTIRKVLDALGVGLSALDEKETP